MGVACQQSKGPPSQHGCNLDSSNTTSASLGMMDQPKQESSWSIAAHVTIPYLIAGMGMVAAGLYFDFVQHWAVFKGLPEIIIMVPALLGLKGNLEMTLASRLSTHANIGNMDTWSARWNMASCNLALVQCQALVVAFLAAAVAILLDWVPRGKFDLFQASLLCGSALVTASLASFILGVVMVAVVNLSRYLGINPDNVATPVAASLGDLITLILLAHVAEFFYQQDNRRWIPAAILLVYLLTSPLWVFLARKNPHTRVVLTTGWFPVVTAMVISSFGGWILDRAIVTYPDLALFQPVINGIGGNIAGVQSSRMGTYLHKNSQLGNLPENEGRVCRSPWVVYFGSQKSSEPLDKPIFSQPCIAPPGCQYDTWRHKLEDVHATAARVLLALVIPGHVIFVLAITLIKEGGAFAGLSLYFMAGYLMAALLQVALLLYVGQTLIPFMWQRKVDPDNAAIPFLTALGDLLGTAFLALTFHSLFLLGDGSIVTADKGIIGGIHNSTRRYD